MPFERGGTREFCDHFGHCGTEPGGVVSRCGLLATSDDRLALGVEQDAQDLRAADVDADRRLLHQGDPNGVAACPGCLVRTVRRAY